MHIYRFMQSGGKLDLQSDTFEQLKPGLSSYADAPEEAAKSLTPLLDSALKTVPAELQVWHGPPSVILAGMRLSMPSWQLLQLCRNSHSLVK